MRRRGGYGYDTLWLPGPHLLRCLARAGLVGTLLFNGGCITTGPLEWVRNGFKVGPNYCRPPAPVAEEWIEAKDPNVQGRHLQYGDWWNVFQDPTLSSLIDTAYAQNLNLRIVGTRVLQARAQQAIAVGNIFPQTQQATGQYSRVALSQNAPNNPAAIAGLVPGSIPSSPLFGNYFSDWIAGFNLSWELDFWGRLRRRIESANADLDASVENFDDALVTLLADVATNYVQYRLAQQRIKIARDNVQIQEGILALAEERFRVGTATQLDVEQARTVLKQTRSTIPALQIVLGQANDSLCILLGIPPRDLEPELGGHHIGRQKEEQGSIQIIRGAIDAGITFMDNCWDYHNGGSEIRMGKALRDGYRQKVFLMTKIDGRTKEAATRQIDQSLKRLQTDCLDLLWFHEVIRLEDLDQIFAPSGAMEAVQAAKQAGKVRFIGFTGHKDPRVHLRMLEVAAEHKFRFNAVQMPLNVMDAHFRSFGQEVLPVLVKEGIGLLGMKSMGDGLILKSQTVPPIECLHYAMNLPTSTVITGIDSLEILKQALEAVRTFKPLTPTEVAALLKRTARAASEGRFERFKTTNGFDGTAKNPAWLGSPDEGPN